MLLPMHVLLHAAATAFVCCCFACVLFTQQVLSSNDYTAAAHVVFCVDATHSDNAVLHHHYLRHEIY